jgi:hypothetical protein
VRCCFAKYIGYDALAYSLSCQDISPPKDETCSRRTSRLPRLSVVRVGAPRLRRLREMPREGYNIASRGMLAGCTKNLRSKFLADCSDLSMQRNLSTVCADHATLSHDSPPVLMRWPSSEFWRLSVRTPGRTSNGEHFSFGMVATAQWSRSIACSIDTGEDTWCYLSNGYGLSPDAYCIETQDQAWTWFDVPEGTRMHGSSLTVMIALSVSARSICHRDQRNLCSRKESESLPKERRSQILGEDEDIPDTGESKSTDP